MSIITTPLPFIFTNGTTADATQVNADLNQIVAGVNANAAAAGSNSDITSLSNLATASHALSLGSTLGVTGLATLSGGAAVTGLATLSGGAAVTGGTTTDTLSVTSTETVTGLLTASGGVSTAALTATGLLTASGGEAVTGGLTTDTLKVSGAVTLSAPVAFHAHRTTNQTSGAVLVYDSIDSQDGGSNYNNTTGQFTAPATGWYSFCASALLSNVTGSPAINSISITVGGINIAEGGNVSQPTATSNAASVATVVKVTSGITVSVQGPALAANNVFLPGTFSSFSGFLLARTV